MKINNLILICTASLLMNISACAHSKLEEECLSITCAFVRDLEQGTLSNEEMVKKYAVEGSYFKNDSIKAFADEWMDIHRMSFNMDGARLEFIKYSEHEDEFLVSDHPIGEPETMHKLVFSLVDYSEWK